MMEDRQRFKTALLEKCIELQKEAVSNAEDAYKEMQQAANDYGPPRDRYDAFRNQLLRKRDLFAQQFQRATSELNILEKIKPEEEKQQVEFGAVVITNKQKMFISIGLGKVELKGETFYAISPQVPIFKAIQDKKEGESYTFNGQKFEIKEVY